MKSIKLLSLIHALNARQRLFLSVVVALGAFLIVPDSIRFQTRLLIAWDAGIVNFLVLAWSMISTADAAQTSRNTLNQDQSGAAILTIVITSASASLFAIGYMLASSKNIPPAPLLGHIICSTIAVVCSWSLVHTVFALHYAHRFYRAGPSFPEKSLEEAGGLDFPGGDLPNYWDFAYFSFVIGMTSQVSDVQITSSPMRRLALLHGVLSFAFNTLIIALSVNILAGLL